MISLLKFVRFIVALPVAVPLVLLALLLWRWVPGAFWLGLAGFWLMGIGETGVWVLRR